MNVVLDEAVEIYTKSDKPRRELGGSQRLNRSSISLCVTPMADFPRCLLTGQIMLKGDNITLIHPAQV
jgi:small nuclear ribonucleoprotein (snRNP)-like protein